MRAHRPRARSRPCARAQNGETARDYAQEEGKTECVALLDGEAARRAGYSSVAEHQATLARRAGYRSVAGIIVVVIVAIALNRSH